MKHAVNSGDIDKGNLYFAYLRGYLPLLLAKKESVFYLRSETVASLNEEFITINLLVSFDEQKTLKNEFKYRSVKIKMEFGCSSGIAMIKTKDYRDSSFGNGENKRLLEISNSEKQKGGLITSPLLLKSIKKIVC